MKKRHWHICLNLLLLLGSTLLAQDMTGAWHNAQYGVVMDLKTDGRFTFKGPYGESWGQWGVQGNTFWMQDASGQMIQYAVLALTNTRLDLVDGNGVHVQYLREVPASSPVSTQDSNTNILAQSGGLRLTSGDVHVGVGLIEFVVGQPITPAEVGELTEASIEEFRANPQAFLSEIASLRQSLGSLHQLRDPVRIGLARQKLVAEFHKATRSIPETDKPLLIQVINRYTEVLAFDAINDLVLTRKDAEAMLDYMQFANQMANQGAAFSLQQRQAFIAELVAGFSQLPLDQKQFLCSASLAWTLIKANWEAFSAAQQQQFQANYAQSPQVQHSGQGYGENGYAGESAQQKMARMQREFNARQNMFQMMQNTALGTHATMLNTIENFGGTGNYWDVVDVSY